MEATVNDLEAMFQKANSDLNYLSRKLDFEFEKDGAGGQVNPQQLIQKVQQVKKDYAAIVKDVQDIHRSQQEAMEFFRGQLTKTCELLSRLQSQTGVQENGEVPDLAALEKLLGVKLPASSVAGGDNLVSGETTAGQSDVTTCGQSQEDSQTTCNAVSQDPVAAMLQSSPATRQKDSHECIELTQEEFESVSSLTRGRVKLSDVNNAYQRLWQHFVDEGNKEDLSTQDMYKMGLKVTGSTGEAKLKVLKSLKLISMSKKGSVNIVR